MARKQQWACAAMAWAVSLGGAGCSNSPYRPGEAGSSALFLSLDAAPSKLDPATSYYIHEADIIDNIYEPPYEYHYLRRPYELQPLAAESIAPPAFFDADGRRLEGDPPVDRVARVEYRIRIRPGMLYAEHPCFARDERGGFVYRDADVRAWRGVRTPYDLPMLGSREVTAADYVRGIRRLADPRLTCPIFATIRRVVLGAGDLNEALARQLSGERERRRAAGEETDEARRPIVLDYLSPPCPGIEPVDRYTFRLTLSRKYPQIRYWMAMHFFAPVPEEAIEFYAQPAAVARRLDLNRWPVGSGPYVLREVDPNRRIVLERNRAYRGGVYPSDGSPGDREAGRLDDAGRPIPFLDRIVYAVEREAIPRWNKFLQGYYDASSVAPDAFDQTIQLSGAGEATLTPDMAERGIRLQTAVQPALYYMAFNMADEVVGGLSPERAMLRRAISIAMDYNEFLEIFYSGQGISAQGPIPPGVFGCDDGEAGVNPFVDRWDGVRGRAVRQSLDTAREWMAAAGYPDGRGPDGRPLTLHLDHAAGGEAAFASIFDWLRARFRLLGIEMRERGTELSRYREKVETGNLQLFRQGWMADYPDPENFLFLFYGPNAKLASKGQNLCNYSNPEYDALFERMEGMMDGPERKAVIDEMVGILRRDAPMVWGMHPTSYLLSHAWYANRIPPGMTGNWGKFVRVDAEERVERQAEWNRPVVWPVIALAGLALAALAPLTLRSVVASRRRRAGKGAA